MLCSRSSKHLGKSQSADARSALISECTSRFKARFIVVYRAFLLQQSLPNLLGPVLSANCKLFFLKLCAGYIWQQVQRIMNGWYHVQHGSKYHIECGRMPCSGSYGVKKTAALCQWKRASLLEMLSSLVC